MDHESNNGPIAGLVFNADNLAADNILGSLYKDFKNKGYTIFFLDRSFGTNGQPDILGIVKTIDKYQILKRTRRTE
ncbi:hypothetical protein D3C83_234230 [compost metagenome]